MAHTSNYMYNAPPNMNTYMEQNPPPSYMHIPTLSLSQPASNQQKQQNQQNQFQNVAMYYSQPLSNIQTFNPVQISNVDYPPLPNHFQNEWHTVTYNRKRHRNSEEHRENSIKRRNKSTG
jgi:hypothetical protein